MKFKFMTYNVMHRADAARRRKYFYCASDVLDSNGRLSRVAKEIQNLGADVVALQEVDQISLDYFQQQLSNFGFRCAVSLLNPRLPSKDGCAIFLNADKFDIVKTHTFRFCDVLPNYCGANVLAGGGNAEAVSFWREVHEKLNLAIATTLSCKETKLNVNIATSHLFWDPLVPDVKLLQAYLLAKELFTYRNLNPAPTVLGGDLNSMPSLSSNDDEDSCASGVYELFTQGQVSTDHPDHPCSRRAKIRSNIPQLKLPQRWRSAYKDVKGSEPKFTNYTAAFRGCLDYIFTIAHEGSSLRTCSALDLPVEEELKREVALPNKMFPSDHLPLVAEFEILQHENMY